MLKRILSIASMCAMLLPFQVSAATTSGDLIKGSSSAVYFFGANGKRYVFPTDKTYFSWYADFSGVHTISDAELASYPLGGNVTYRPGVRLVKITTDPRVYAVAHGGVLRWIQSEAIAASLYGSTWARNVDDIPDTFFINYTMGTAIASATDYSPSTEVAGSTTINMDKNLQPGTVTPPPAPTPTPAPLPPPPTGHNGILSVSPTTNPRAGDSVSLQGYANYSSSISDVKLYFNNVLQKNCYLSPCSVDVTLPLSNAQPSYPIRAEFTWIDWPMVTVSSTIIASTSTPSINLTITKPEVAPGYTREFVVDADRNFLVRYIDIFVDDVDIHGCTNIQICRYSDTEMNATGTHSVYATASDTNGQLRRTATQTYRTVTNDHPRITVTPGKSALFTGETLDVTVTANDDNGVATTEVWLDGTLLKHCDMSTCTVVAGPWTQPRNVNFVGKATDLTGLASEQTGPTVTVQ